MKTLALYTEVPKLAVEETPPLHVSSTCVRCSLGERKEVRRRCMAPELFGHAGDDTAPARLLVITQHPGEAEDRAGRPLVSATGSYVRELVKSWPNEVVFDHAVRCSPGAHDVKDGMIAECRPYLAQTVRETAPVRILCFGLESVKAVMGRGFTPMSCRRGYAYMNVGDAQRVPVFFLLSPAQATRNRFMRAWLEEDTQWALTANPDPLPLHGAAYMIETEVDSRVACDEVRDAGGMTYDLETFGAPGNKEQTVLSVAVTPYQCDYAYVWDNNALQRHHLRAELFKLLEDDGVEKCGHNLKFDQLHMETRFGITVRGHVQDTMLMRKLHESHVEGKLALAQALVGMGGGKDEAAGYVAAGVKELKKMVVDSKTQPVLFNEPTDAMAVAVARIKAGDDPKRYAYAAIPTVVRARYNAADAVSTDRLRMHLQRQRWEPGVRDVWDTIMVPLHHAIVGMERNGIGVSKGAIRHLQVAMSGRVAEAEATLRQYGEVNPNAPNDVGKFLYETLKLPVAGKTTTGKYSTDAATLQDLKHPAAAAILAYRRAAKFKTQFADGMDHYIRDDGRIHASINLAGTESGRLSCVVGGTLVLTRRGEIAIAEVVVGDEVWTHRGRWRRVTAVLNQGMRHVALYSFGTLRTLMCTPDHHVLTNGQWLPIAECHACVACIDFLDKDIGHLFGTTIRHVKDCGRHEVFDLTVDEDHSFVAEGVYVHNCSEPNLFNIPGRGTDDGKLCRDIFVAPEGHVILEADYSQIEIRLAALLSGDPVMIDFIRSGADFHLATAKLVAPMFGVKPEDVDKEHWLRGASKTVNFGVLYGEGAGGLAMQLKISKVQAQKLMDAIFGKFTRLKTWIDQQLSFVRRKGFCRTYWNGVPARVRNLPMVGEANDAERSSAERASYNTPVQGSATEYTNASLGFLHHELQARRLPAKLILTVYDSIMLEVQASALHETAALVKQVMTGWPSGNVPMSVDMKSGVAWGSLEKLEVP